MRRFDGPDCGEANCGREIGHIGDHRPVPTDPPECGICGDYTAWGPEVHEVCLRGLLLSHDVTRRVLGILWNSTGYRSENLAVRDLFDPNDDLVIEVERLAIMPDWAVEIAE